MGDTLGKRIKARRLALGLSQIGLAEAVGVRNTTMLRYEKDEITPSAETLEKIAERLGVTSRFLVRGSDASPEARVDPTDGDKPAPIPEEVLLRIAKRTGLDERRTQSFLRHRWSGGMPSEATLESYALDMLREQRRAELSGETEDAPPPNAFMDRGKKRR